MSDYLYDVAQITSTVCEDFPFPSEICGIALLRRTRRDKICLWTASAHKKYETLVIGEKLKEKLGISPTASIYYERHTDAMFRGTIKRFYYKL